MKSTLRNYVRDKRRGERGKRRDHGHYEDKMLVKKKKHMIKEFMQNIRRQEMEDTISSKLSTEFDEKLKTLWETVKQVKEEIKKTVVVQPEE